MHKYIHTYSIVATCTYARQLSHHERRSDKQRWLRRSTHALTNRCVDLRRPRQLQESECTLEPFLVSTFDLNSMYLFLLSAVRHSGK